LSLLDRGRTALVVIDVQEAFRPSVQRFERVAQNVSKLVQGARVLGLPIVVTEQYPQGLGATVPEVGLGEGDQALAKVCFAASRADGFDLQGRDQALLCGIEAHVCVSQTAHDLIGKGVDVHVARDAVSSRRRQDRDVGLRKMERAGAVITSVETALFELLGAAGTPEFKEIQGLVK
jgi:nicotinamidase-related amidase